MNVAYNAYSNSDCDYQAGGLEYEQFQRLSSRRWDRARYSRRSRGPVAFNGIHRRRNKRWSFR